MPGFMTKIPLYELEYAIGNVDVRNDIKYLLDNYLLDAIENYKSVYYKLNMVSINYITILDVEQYNSIVNFEHIYLIKEELVSTLEVMIFNLVRKLNDKMSKSREAVVEINSFMVSDGYIVCMDLV